MRKFKSEIHVVDVPNSPPEIELTMRQMHRDYLDYVTAWEEREKGYPIIKNINLALMRAHLILCALYRDLIVYSHFDGMTVQTLIDTHRRYLMMNMDETEKKAKESIIKTEETNESTS